MSLGQNPKLVKACSSSIFYWFWQIYIKKVEIDVI